MNKEELKTLITKWQDILTGGDKRTKEARIAKESISKLNRLYVCIGGKE